MAGILRTDTIQNSNTSTIITQTNSTTITIGTTGQTIALASGASSSGFGATYNGAVNWDTTPKTTTVTAVSGTGYFVNTTSAGITVNLPAGSAGSIVALSDYAGTWNTNNITVAPNGTNKIGGVNANAILSTQGQTVTFVYVDSTRGWVNVGDATYVTGNPYIIATGGTITTCGNYKIHAFTGPGTFTVSSAAINPANNNVDYLVVAGGGGGASYSLGGGGAGGFRMSTAMPVSATGYPITVGAGGTGGTSPNQGVQGSPSIFNGITSTGGGGGGNWPTPGGPTDGSQGGSGGAIGRDAYLSGRTSANNGNSPPVSPSQGNPGGVHVYPAGASSSAGGGGAGGAGNNNSGQTSGAGGSGSSAAPVFGAAPKSFYPVTGPGAGYFAGGGGGGYFKCSPGCGAAGGLGGGGTGGDQPLGKGSNGVTNSGGGGGGGNNPGSGPAPSGGGSGGSGGSGIVLIRYQYQ